MTASDVGGLKANSNYDHYDCTSVSGTGDPHLQNMLGERFDLMRPGVYALLSIPRGKPVEDELLVVEADARQNDGQCAEMYFMSLNITGKWADKVQPGGLRYDAGDARDAMPKWVKFGPVELKVARGGTSKGDRYLNVFAKHLGRAGFPVGGLLGVDDHGEAETIEAECHKSIALTGDKDIPVARSASSALATAA